jgi:hypothetical protein
LRDDLERRTGERAIKAWSGEPGSTLIETSAPVSFWLLEIASRWRANL